MSIAERLIAARGDIPREKVANAIGVTVSAISMYETGNRVPRDEIKIKLASFYKTTVQALFLIRLVTISDLVLIIQTRQTERRNHAKSKI